MTDKNVIQLDDAASSETSDRRARELLALVKNVDKEFSRFTNMRDRLDRELSKQSKEMGQIQFIRWLIENNLSVWVMHHLRRQDYRSWQLRDLLWPLAKAMTEAGKDIIP